MMELRYHFNANNLQTILLSLGDTNSKCINNEVIMDVIEILYKHYYFDGFCSIYKPEFVSLVSVVNTILTFDNIKWNEIDFNINNMFLDLITFIFNPCKYSMNEYDYVMDIILQPHLIIKDIQYNHIGVNIGIKIIHI